MKALFVSFGKQSSKSRKATLKEWDKSNYVDPTTERKRLQQQLTDGRSRDYTTTVIYKEGFVS